MKKILLWSISTMIVFMMIGTVSAVPEMLELFNTTYATFGTGLDTCDICHVPKELQKQGNMLNLFGIDLISTKPRQDDYRLDQYNEFNSYGKDFKDNLKKGISETFSKIENLDSDKDKYSNINEINEMTLPGEKKDFPSVKNDKSKDKKKRRSQMSPIEIIDISEISNYSPP